VKPIKTLSSNHNFGPPLGQEETIGYREVVSVWELSPAERQAIANGQNIRLGVGWIGAFPPVSLGVTHEVALFEPEDVTG
jgi:hypothetical protein